MPWVPPLSAVDGTEVSAAEAFAAAGFAWDLDAATTFGGNGLRRAGRIAAGLALPFSVDAFLAPAVWVLAFVAGVCFEDGIGCWGMDGMSWGADPKFSTVRKQAAVIQRLGHAS